MKRYTDGQADSFEEFLLTLSFAERSGAPAGGAQVAGYLAPCVGAGDAPVRGGACVRLDGELTKVSLRLEHQDPVSEMAVVYRSERFVTEGDGQFRGVWMCGARTGRFSAARRSSPEDTRKQRKSACRRKADAEIRSKRFFNDLKDDLLILDRLGWSEQRWKGESKLEKGRAILLELRRELGEVFEGRGIRFHPHTPWLQRVEAAIGAAREAGDSDLLRQLRAVDCSCTAPAEDRRSDWHTLLEIQRGFCALPPFRATRYLEPSNVRHALRCAEIPAASPAFETGGLYLGGARQLLGAPRPGGAEFWDRALRELRPQCLAGDLGVDEAYDVRVQLVIRAGGSEFLWEPGPEVKLRAGDRVYYEQAHVWCEDRRQRRYRHGQDAGEMQRRLAEFERFLTGGREELVYEEDFEFVEMTARAESGAAEGVPAFLEHSVTGEVGDARELHQRAGEERGWARRPKALSLGQLFKTRLAGYRRLRSREIVWGPGPGLYWERGDRPLRLLRMSQEPVRVFFSRREEPYGFHLQDVRGGTGGTEVIEVIEGSPADARGVVVGRTVKRLCSRGRSWDVRHWGRAQIEEALAGMPDGFFVEFGKGDTEERRHAPLGDAEMAILMDERFMRGFLHELWHGHEAAGRHFDREGWARVFPGLEAAAETPELEAPHLASGSSSPSLPPRRQALGGEARGASPEGSVDSAREGAAGLWATPPRRLSPPGRPACTTSAALPAAQTSGESGGQVLGPACDGDAGPPGLGVLQRVGGTAFTPPVVESWQVLRPDYPLKVPISVERSSWPVDATVGCISLVGPSAEVPAALLWAGHGPDTSGVARGGAGMAEPAWRSAAPMPAYARAPPGLPPPSPATA